VVDTRHETRTDESAFAALWRRAPLFRAAAVGAATVTLAAAVFWAESQRPEPPATAIHSVAPSAEHRALAPPPPSAPDSGAPSTSSPQPSGTASAAHVAAAIPASDEEEQILATCHPHLLHAPSMPQIDVANVPAPNLGHIRMHFWVNGAGTVTRETVTAATLGTPTEQQAAADFGNQLTFVLPNTKDCRSREVEVIGDFFEQRGPSGQWQTLVRLYPRLTFGPTGALQRAD
jgi:hypothetical protein